MVFNIGQKLSVGGTLIKDEERLFYLDALKCVSIALIVICHVHLSISQIDVLRGGAMDSLYIALAGVSVFFFVSGYLSRQSLEKYSPVKFMANRFVRLYPLYLVFLVITLASYSTISLTQMFSYLLCITTPIFPSLGDPIWFVGSLLLLSLFTSVTARFDKNTNFFIGIRTIIFLLIVLSSRYLGIFSTSIILYYWTYVIGEIAYLVQKRKISTVQVVSAGLLIAATLFIYYNYYNIIFLNTLGVIGAPINALELMFAVLLIVGILLGILRKLERPIKRVSNLTYQMYLTSGYCLPVTAVLLSGLASTSIWLYAAMVATSAFVLSYIISDFLGPRNIINRFSNRGTQENKTGQ
jgi:peptidoglycan/LPS O-acetylase OafA/YrhL